MTTWSNGQEVCSDGMKALGLPVVKALQMIAASRSEFREN